MRGYHVAIVGATGLVGRTMLQVLDERKFPISELTLLASKNSAGKQIPFRGKLHDVQVLNETSFKNVEFALFSAGSTVSHQYAPIAAEAGAIAIDNSSAWRLTKNIPLVVPEVNPKAMRKINGDLKSRIIANPNCSTIQLVAALKPLHDKYKIKRVVVSTYQSVSGAGKRGLEQLENELAKKPVEHPKFPYPIAFNCIFHDFPYEDGYTSEEYKMIHETRKILSIDGLRITVTCVRVPVTGGHSESVNIEFEQKCTPEDARAILAKTKGIIVQDDPTHDVYPMPINAYGKDEVFVGRIRRDDSVRYGINLWVVSDNLRKGAATNAVQIAEKLIEMELV
ncbi:MAG TPA: aspartate-semialdehyde dehydrogenase [Candidatus Kapabacteria bacterium]|nr:aspartate-semialdehyde dehydrogenase [Candidatus Kapabacteria bacterium]